MWLGSMSFSLFRWDHSRKRLLAQVEGKDFQRKLEKERPPFASHAKSPDSSQQRNHRQASSLVTEERQSNQHSRVSRWSILPNICRLKRSWWRSHSQIFFHRSESTSLASWLELDIRNGAIYYVTNEIWYGIIHGTPYVYTIWPIWPPSYQIFLDLRWIGRFKYEVQHLIWRIPD